MEIIGDYYYYTIPHLGLFRGKFTTPPFLVAWIGIIETTASHTTNPRWRTVDVWKSIPLHISAVVWTIFTNRHKNLHDVTDWPYESYSQLTICLFKIQHGGWRSLVSGSIAQIAKRRYLIYSEADFEVFRRQGDTLPRWGWKLEGPLLHAKFNSSRLGYRIGPPKLKFLLRFAQNVEYKRPAGAYPFRDFHTIRKVCTRFQVALAVKISLDLLMGLWSYGGFKLTGSGCPQIFSAP